MNGPFDPDFTSTGAQPVNYDDWSAQYDTYQVESFTFKVSGLVTQSTNWVIVPMHISTAQTSAAKMDSAMSNPLATMRTVTTVQGIPTPITRNIKMSTFFGQDEMAYRGSDVHVSAYTTYPADQCFLHLISQHVDQTTSQTSYYDIELIYHMFWYDRVESQLDLMGRIERLVLSRTSVQGEPGYSSRDQKEQKAPPGTPVYERRIPKNRQPLPSSLFRALSEYKAVKSVIPIDDTEL